MSRKAQSEALEKTGPAALANAVPEYLQEFVGKDDGAENIQSSDIRPPALRIAQSMSPEVKRSEPRYIEGLQEGDVYNSLTQENYGQDPFEFIVIAFLGHRNVEFVPMNEGGGVRDFNVKDEDPRTQFTTIIKDGKEVRQKPVATKFYDYLVLKLNADGRRELMALSMKGTQLKIATRLNTLIKVAQLPTFALLFKAQPVPEKKGTYSYFNWKIDRAGFPTQQDVLKARELQSQLKGKKIDLTDATDPEPEAGEGGGDDIPF